MKTTNKEKWQFLSAINYNDQDFIIEVRPQITETGKVYMETRSSWATKEEIKRAHENTEFYYSTL